MIVRSHHHRTWKGLVGGITIAAMAAGCASATTKPDQPNASGGGGGLATSGGQHDSNVIKIGVLTDLEGSFGIIGADTVRGAKQAVAEFGGQVAGKRVEIVVESGDATPNTAVAKAQKLLQQQGVDFVIGPISGDEGLAVKELARRTPDHVFINGASAAQDFTLRNPAPNVFRFSTDGAQWMAGLGSYIYDGLGYRRIATVAEDYSYPYTQVGGLMDEFCAKGGHVVQKAWVPIGTSDYGSVISAIPKDADAVYVALGGSDAVNFLKQANQYGLTAKIIGGTSTLDQTTLSTKGQIAKQLVGTPSAGPIASDDPSPAWQKYVADYKQQFPDGLPTPGLFSEAYYVETKAALMGLQQVNGDLSGGQSRFAAALAHLTVDSPTGPVKLDDRRNAIAANYVTQVKMLNGALTNVTIRKLPAVDQTFGLPFDQYVKRAPYDRDHPTCP